MKTKKEIKLHLELAYMVLKKAEKEPIGDCKWRQAKRYIDALEWVLELD